MSGRPRKEYLPIYRSITMELDDITQIPCGESEVLCPICRSSQIGKIGYQRLKSGIVEKFQCKNLCCPARAYLKQGKQFYYHTSAFFRDALADHLERILSPLVQGKTTQKAIGEHFHRSPALITLLRQKIQHTLDQKKYLHRLVLIFPREQAVAIDEMFVTIEGKVVYIIVATTYGKKKVVGIKVATSRDETTLRAVFDEAERNNGKHFKLLTIDAWGGSQKMAKNLLRPITVVIHKHKAPYDKAVIWDIRYNKTKTLQTIHKFGIKTNFFTTRHKREYWYLKDTENLKAPPSKPRGRPKGKKNGSGKGKYQRKPDAARQKRGPKGIFTVFDKGQKGYAKVDPGKKNVKIARGGSTTVSAVLNRVIMIYAKMTIQNNLAENINSVIEYRVWLSGPRNDESLEKRLRTFLFFYNNPKEIPKIRISHQLRSDLLKYELNRGIFGHITRASYLYRMRNQKGAIMN